MATLEETYPHIAEWVDTWGWIEIGEDNSPLGFVRAIDPGGLVWESEQDYMSLDEAFKALEAALAEHMGDRSDDDEED